MAPPRLLARPLATLAAGLLVAGLLQAAPASAGPITAPYPALAVIVLADGLPGGTVGDPASLGPAPASAKLLIRVDNSGLDRIRGLAVATSLVTNGTVSDATCDLSALVDDGTGPVLEIGKSVTCSAEVSGVDAASVHESLVTASGTGVDTLGTASTETHFFATASEPPAPALAAAALTISAPTSAVIGSQVAVTGSLSRAGAPYAASTILERQDDVTGSWVPVKPVASSIDGALTTSVTADRSANYRFRFDGDATTLPATSATVRVDARKEAVLLTATAPASAVEGSTFSVKGAITRAGQAFEATTQLQRQVAGGSWTTVEDVQSSSTGGLSATVKADESASYRFSYAGNASTSAATSPSVHVVVVPKQAVTLTASAPTRAVTGTTITVKGTITRAGKAFATTTQLQRQVGDGAWTTVKDVKSSSKGALSTTVKAETTAGYRYSYAGTSTIAAATSPTVRVTVVPKEAVSLTASAPARAVAGATITIKGSIKRAGKAFATTTQLQRQGGDGAWTTVKDVKSSNGALSTTVKAERTAGYRYRYAGTATIAAGTSNVERVTVAKATVKLTVKAPASVTKGKSIKVKGSIKRERKGYRTTTVLEFRAGGGWSTVKKVKSSSKGALSTSVKPSRTGEYRFRFAGNATTASGTSGGDRVTVKPKPPAKPKPKAYKNCTALVKVYPHGVGRSGARDKGGDVTEFTRDTATYNKNKKSDRDKDGIACERH